MNPYYSTPNGKLYCGNCLDVLKTMPSNSVDAVVTDPPYGINFMGKKWDYDVPAVEVWKEALRVLKPGGHLLSFGGTRTYHRMVVNIEDAGFEIRDQIQWLYGCLSEDTEILTINGWERYHKAIDKCPVCAYNIHKDSFEFQMPKRKFVYENEHTAYRIQSDNTDQIVSRNHRVIVEREGKLIFQRAETLKQQEDIPFLESLSDLPEAIYGVYQRASSKEQRLQRMLQSQNGKMEQGETAEKNNLPYLQEEILSNRTEQKETTKVLLKDLCRKSKKLAEGYRIFRKKRMDREEHGGLFKKNDRPEQSRMEGWYNLFQKTRELCSNKICQMSERIPIYGSQGRLCYGTSSYNGSIVEQESFENRGCSSYQPQSTRQQDRKPNAVSNEQSTQTIRRTRATITPIEYHGKVWCVEVPSGAFVARRNGKIFITGNSGFPKSLDIGKAVDKLQGNKREVMGRNPNSREKCNKKNTLYEHGLAGGTDYNTQGNTQYEGWGTALKPANEPICLARKPISEKTVAANVLKWGTGGINIDGCRVEATSEKDLKEIRSERKTTSKGQFVTQTKDDKFDRSNRKNISGRFPANVIHDGSDEVVGLFPNTKSGSGDKHGRKPSTFCASTDWEAFKGTSNGGDSGSAARFFYCAKASRSERNAGCEGMKRVTWKEQGFRDNNSTHLSPRAGAGRLSAMQNSHPTVKPVKLIQYLCKLITPKGGIVLDLFSGSGTTGVACEKINRKWIMIEQEEKYCSLSAKRIEQERKQRKMF